MTTIRVSDPVDLVKVLPYLLGYHPHRSLAAVGLRDRRLTLVQRVDLPVLPPRVVAAADLMVRQLRAAHCTAVVVVVHEDEAGQGRAAGAELAGRVQDTGLALTEHLVVRGGRVFFPDCPHDCHPDAGIALPEDRDVAALADFVALGASPLPTREDLALRVAPAGDRAVRAVRAAARSLEERSFPKTLRRRALADWGRFLDTTSTVFREAPASAAAAARMAASLADVAVRDLLLAWLCPGTLDLEVFDAELLALARILLPAPAPRRGEDWRAAAQVGDLAAVEAPAALVDRLCWLARHTPGELAPGVLTVLASYTWWLGDGALASTALDRALAIDPAYRLGRLVEALVSLGIRPPHAADRVQALDVGTSPPAGSV